MIRRPLIASPVILTLIALLTPALGSAAQSSTAPAPPPQRSLHESTPMHRHMADMKAGEARLEALVQEMAAAVGESRIVAMAAVIRELVEQQRDMRSRMADRHHTGVDSERAKPAAPDAPEHQHGVVH
jgi:hypothetical protein